jgi:hypothetical protein
MKRAQEERHLAAQRQKMYVQLVCTDNAAAYGRRIKTGRFRKSLRAGGCGNSRCQLCHPEKYPKRIPTLKEQTPWRADE